LDSEKLSTTELRRILMSKEELLTDVKNLLYRRTDDVERLQKVIGDTERQFVGSLRQIKALGEELEDLRGAARELVDMVDNKGIKLGNGVPRWRAPLALLRGWV
jgi:hypothetical protein